MKVFICGRPSVKHLEDRPKLAIQSPSYAIVKIVKTTIYDTDLHILNLGRLLAERMLSPKCIKRYTAYTANRSRNSSCSSS